MSLVQKKIREKGVRLNQSNIKFKNNYRLKLGDVIYVSDELINKPNTQEKSILALIIQNNQKPQVQSGQKTI